MCSIVFRLGIAVFGTEYLASVKEPIEELEVLRLVLWHWNDGLFALLPVLFQRRLEKVRVLDEQVFVNGEDAMVGISADTYTDDVASIATSALAMSAYGDFYSCSPWSLSYVTAYGWIRDARVDGLALLRGRWPHHIVVVAVNRCRCLDVSDTVELGTELAAS